MCNVAIASLAMTAAGTLVSGMGQAREARANAASANYQAGVARNNAILAERYAFDAELQGRADAEKEKLLGRQRLALGQVNAAATGGAVNKGTLLELREAQAGFTAANVANIEHNAAKAALGFITQGPVFAQQAALLRQQAQDSSATLGIAGTLLTGAGQVASRWYKFQQAGAFA